MRMSFLLLEISGLSVYEYGFLTDQYRHGHRWKISALHCGEADVEPLVSDDYLQFSFSTVIKVVTAVPVFDQLFIYSICYYSWL